MPQADSLRKITRSFVKRLCEQRVVDDDLDQPLGLALSQLIALAECKRNSRKRELLSAMTAGHLLAASDRIVTNLKPILEEHGISCDVECMKECDHARHVIDLTSLICKNGKAQIGMGIEKRRGRNGVDIVLAPECRSFFRRNLDSEKLAKEIAEILCQHGASEEPHARCEDLE